MKQKAAGAALPPRESGGRRDASDKASSDTGDDAAKKARLEELKRKAAERAKQRKQSEG